MEKTQSGGDVRQSKAMGNGGAQRGEDGEQEQAFSHSHSLTLVLSHSHLNPLLLSFSLACLQILLEVVWFWRSCRTKPVLQGFLQGSGARGGVATPLGPYVAKGTTMQHKQSS